MWGRAQLLVLLTALLRTHGDEGDEARLQVGRAVDVFQRYGYLSISMKVAPRADASPYLFREPTIDIFPRLERFAETVHKRGRKQEVFSGDFHLEFCDNVRQLMQAYFRDFRLERLDNAWRAFAGSWTTDQLARNLGINASFVHKEHCYVLVRLSRFREDVRLTKIPNNVNLAEEVAREIDQIKVGDVASVIRFIKKYGTHYIDAYVTGDSIYQVFIYRKDVYKTIRERLKTQGFKKIDKLEIEQFFSPWYAEHVGKIRVASGNRTVEEWAERKLRVHYYIFQYQTLIKIHNDSKLLRLLNDLLQNEALLELDMKSLDIAFKDPSKKKFFLEVIDNIAKLWEVNL